MLGKNHYKILYFIRKPEKERKYEYESVNIPFHYTTLVNSETQGRLCSPVHAPETFSGGSAPRGRETLTPHAQSNLPKIGHNMF